MKIKMAGVALVALLTSALVSADCNFTFVNKSSHPVTLQGFFVADGDDLVDAAWIQVPPTRQIFQVRSGKKCNSTFQHTSQIDTRVNLKNNSGYWVGNKGVIFTPDRSYSHYAAERAQADDGKTITLSNGVKVTNKEFKVFICEGAIDSDDCH